MNEFRYNRNPFTEPACRAHCPVEAIKVGEEMTECGYCGARTELECESNGKTRREVCLNCRQRYDVEDEQGDDSADDLFVCDSCGVKRDIKDSVTNRITDSLVCKDCAAAPLDAAEANRIDRLVSTAGEPGPYPDAGNF